MFAAAAFTDDSDAVQGIAIDHHSELRENSKGTFYVNIHLTSEKDVTFKVTSS